MLTGYKTYIGIGLYTLGAMISGFGYTEAGSGLMEFGKIVAAGGFIAKINRAMNNK